MAAEWISDPTNRTQTNEGPGAIPGLFHVQNTLLRQSRRRGLQIGSLHRVYDIMIDRPADLQGHAHSRFDRTFDPAMFRGGVLSTIVDQTFRSPHIPEQLRELVGLEHRESPGGKFRFGPTVRCTFDVYFLQRSLMDALKIA